MLADKNDPSVIFEHLWPDHQIGNAAFVFQGDEHHTLGASGALTHKHNACGFKPFAVAGFHRFRAGDNALFRQIFPQERNWMASQRQAAWR